MRSYIPSMVQAITVLTVLKMMTKAQTSCGSGSMNGKVMYERLPNIQLQAFDDDIVRDTGPPFTVLEKCQDLCLRNRASNNIVRTCSSLDFQPGSRIATFNGGAEYEESTCYLTQEQARPDGIGVLSVVPNSIHFNEICITSNRPERECPNRRYVFERHPRKKLKLPNADIKEMPAFNRTECEDLCLNEFSFVCRSATFDNEMRICILSRFTRRTHPELLQDDSQSEYLENTCLNAERRCDGLAVFIKEENKRLGGPFEVDMFTNLTLEDCQGMCVRAEKYLCRSVEYDEMTKQCTLSEEDSVSQKDDIGVASSPSHHFYDFVCLDSPRGSEYPDNSVTSHLFAGKKPDTAFQRYRNSRLGGEHHSEISDRSLSECLDECLRQPSFQCKSAEYSERFRTCRLTRYSQKDGMRIIYDADYDYYENLMLGGDGDLARPGEGGSYRPGDHPGVGTYRPGSDSGRYPPASGGRYPVTTGSRYPPSGGYHDRYPIGQPTYDRYPEYDDRYDDRFQGRPDRYPVRPGRYPIGPDRYHHFSDGRRYPLSSSGGKYSPSSSGGKYPIEDRDRFPGYPPSSSGIIYGVGSYRPRYPSEGDGYGDRYDVRYGDRFGDKYDYRHDSPLGDKVGGRYGGGIYGDDRISYGYRGGGGGNRIYNGDRYGNRGGGGNRYDSTRYDYYGDDRDGGSRWFFRPDRRPLGRPLDLRPGYDRPVDGRPPPERPLFEDRPYGHPRPVSPGPDGPIYDSFGGVGPNRPYNTRCDDGDNFKQMATRQRARKEFIRISVYAPTLIRCQQECMDARDFTCRAFNYRESGLGSYDAERDNCELSDRDSRDLEIGNPQYFDSNGGFDFYERSPARNGIDGECLDVSQVCNDDGMEFTLRTPEGFYGRIYTYGFYDRCFFRGNGGTINVLRISGAHGYPECGTQRYGDTMTNIVVVQFSDYVQTGKDKRFNLTCLFRGPGEAVVSSGFIGAGSGSPIPIEYLPAENTLSSKVRLLILYQGRPTTTIAVGDPLTFRIEAQDGYNYANDIFATNVVARDPYSGRSVQLIDRFGCPIDSFVFPELDKGRSGDSLEARFNAFKIPESNFLVFEATVRTCRDGCQPAYCQTGTGRSEPSFGRRRRRSLNNTLSDVANNASSVSNEIKTDLTELRIANDPTISFIKRDLVESNQKKETEDMSNKQEADGVTDEKSIVEEKTNEEEEYVREMIEVFDTRDEMPQARRAEPASDAYCLTAGEYHGLVSTVFVLIAVLLTASLLAGLAYRKYWLVMRKNMLGDRISSSNFSTSPSYPTTRSSGLSPGVSFFGTIQKPFSGFGVGHPSMPILSKAGEGFHCFGQAPGGPFEDPSEPIYTDPSLFERSRSLRSIAVTPKRRKSPSVLK
ncbi:uncharacterized protein LOC132697826 isoform X2 [Cylas formicarius]|uniref:uncharacterized protein LOC132697826 isoform X2 n=1 Tax=Cylas formicarius TaxID=197179 RepID=UPI002958B6C3|nr:uncharacterized protein LOC132697826 isoform X2 [Cylas formicarius]